MAMMIYIGVRYNFYIRINTGMENNRQLSND